MDGHGTITKADLLTIIEEVGFGQIVVGGWDPDGVVIDGYLDLARIADRLNQLYALRGSRRLAAASEQAR